MESITTISPENLKITLEEGRALLPLIIVLAGALIGVILSGFNNATSKWLVYLTSLAVCVLGGIYAFFLMENSALLMFNRMFVSDSYSHFFNMIFLASAALTILISFRYLDKESLQHPEYYVLILLSTLGMMVMASSLDLIVIFIALELMSLTVYTLVGFRRADRKSNEAAMKYFILGGAASAVFLYGAALSYGVVGSTNLRDILSFVQNRQELPLLFTLGSWAVIVGFLFKVASVPFHMWMPDVYEGAPAPITGFMTTGLKAATFATFVRVFVYLGYGNGLAETLQNQLHDILWVLAVLTMIIGNVIALTQTNLKRMLAYSSIAHTGYLMVGILAGSGNDQGYAPVINYLVAYSVMNIGAFAVLSVLSGKGDGGLNLQNLAGLSRRHPWLSFAMAAFLFAMAGIPPTAGFMAKYLIFYSAVQAGEIPLVIIAVLCSAISVYYYLRVLVYMYMREPSEQLAEGNLRVPAWAGFAVATMVIITLQAGILPSYLIDVAKRAVLAL